MKSLTRRSLITGLGASLATPALSRSISSSDITRIQVRKRKRKLDLIGSNRVLKSYNMYLGRNPVGHKNFVGDNKTPEGVYWIDRRNPYSSFHLSLGVSYPNSNDVSYARSRGRSPGGDIFIHGQPNGIEQTIQYDWTRGCIAVSNSDMTELFNLIPVGCKISIHA